MFHLVVRSGNYYLFETDSEEEEEEEKKEEEEPRKKSAFQVLYGNLLSHWHLEKKCTFLITQAQVKAASSSKVVLKVLEIKFLAYLKCKFALHFKHCQILTKTIPESYLLSFMPEDNKNAKNKG